MPEIPGVTALHGDGEPGLDLMELHTHTHTITTSHLCSSLKHITYQKLEKPWQKKCPIGSPGPMGLLLLQPVMNVSLGSLTFCALFPPFVGPPISFFFFWGGGSSNSSPKPNPYVIPPWQDQQPWQLSTWPKRLTDPCQGLHNKQPTGDTAAWRKFSLIIWKHQVTNPQYYPLWQQKDSMKENVMHWFFFYSVEVFSGFTLPGSINRFVYIQLFVPWMD